MRIPLLTPIFAVLICSLSQAADLPTVTIEHLRYLCVRGERVRQLSADDMIDYCIAQKIGGNAFDDLYSRLFSMRIDLTKLQRVEGLSDDDSRVKSLKKTYAVEYGLLSDEAQRVQRGIVQEGIIATQTLESIGRTPLSRF